MSHIKQSFSNIFNINLSTVKNLKNILTIFVIIIIFNGCSDLFNNSERGPDLTLNTTEAVNDMAMFNGDTLVFKKYGPAYEDTLNTGELPAFTFETNNNQLKINGYYYAYGRGFTPVADLKTSGQDITIIVRPPEKKGVVLSMPQGFIYQAYLSNLEKGNYTIKIIHERDLIYLKEDQVPDKNWSVTTFNKKIGVN